MNRAEVRTPRECDVFCERSKECFCDFGMGLSDFLIHFKVIDFIIVVMESALAREPITH